MPRVAPLLLLLLSGPLAPATAAADRVDKLVGILQRQPDVKVRLQVVLALGTLGSPRGVPALQRALSDDERAVRGLAARSLAAIGDVRALPALERRIHAEGDPLALTQLKAATRRLRVLAQGPPRGTRVYIALGRIQNRSGGGSGELSPLLGEYLLQRLGELPGVAVDWAGRTPTGAELRRRSVRGLRLDGEIEALDHRQRPGTGEVEVSCRVTVRLSDLASGRVREVYRGGTSLVTPAGSFTPRYRPTFQVDLLQLVAGVVKRHFARSPTLFGASLARGRPGSNPRRPRGGAASR